jgi:nitrite reductase/ring-hydroxylating ferredoxin subunit
MTFVHLQAGQNFIDTGSATYLVLVDGSGIVRAVPDQCPHRGGPLHLGQWTANGDAIVCPWHGSKLRTGALHRRGLPTVSRRGSTTVALELAEGVRPSVMRRRVPVACSQTDGAGQCQ